MNGSLLDLDVATGLDVQHRSCSEGQRDMRVKNQSEMLVASGRSLQKPLELGIERFCPVGLVTDGSLIKVRDEIKHYRATILQPIEGVLERFHAEHHVGRPSPSNNPSRLQASRNVFRLKSSLPWRKPLKCDVVVHEAALAYGDAAQTTVLKQQVQVVPMILK